MPKIIFRLDDIFEYLNEWGKACDFDPSETIDDIKQFEYFKDEDLENVETDSWGKRVLIGNKISLERFVFSFYVSNLGWDIGDSTTGFVFMRMANLLPRDDIWQNILLKNHPQDMAQCLIETSESNIEYYAEKKEELTKKLEKHKKLYLPGTAPIKNLEQQIEGNVSKIRLNVRRINELSKKYGIDVDVETLATTYGVDISETEQERGK